MFLCDQSTRKSFPLRAENVVIGAPSRGGLFGDTQRKRFAKGDTDSPLDVILMDGKFYCVINGERIELHHTKEAIAALLGQRPRRR